MGSAALLTLSSCSLKDVRVDYDPGASLTELKTYSWVVNAGAYGGRDLVDGGSDRRLGYRSGAESVDYGTYESDERRDDSPLFSSLLDNRIRGAVDSELLRLGYELSTEDDADFRIDYRLMLDDRREVWDLGYYSAYQFGGHHGFGHHGFGHHGFGHRGFGHSYRFGYGGFYGAPYGSPAVLERAEVTLILDVIDAKSGKLIWRGWTSDVLSRDPEPEKVRDYVNEAVPKILKKFKAA